MAASEVKRLPPLPPSGYTSTQHVTQDGSPPRTPSTHSRRNRSRKDKGKGPLQPLKVKPPSRQTFLEDKTPVTPVDRSKLPEAGDTKHEQEQPRDSHDLSLSQREGPPDSLVDSMLLSLDQFTPIEPPPMRFEGNGVDNNHARQFNSFTDGPRSASLSSIHQDHGRARAHTHSSSMSSEYDVRAHDPLNRYSTQFPRGRRSNSSSNLQSVVESIHSLQGMDKKRGKVFESQRAVPKRPTHQSRGPWSMGSKGSLASSVDLSDNEGYDAEHMLSAMDRAPGVNASGFDDRMLHSSPPEMMQGRMAGHSWTQPDLYSNYDPADFDAAPTPTIPAGPRSVHYPPQPTFAPPQTPNTDNRRRSKPPRTLYKKHDKSEISSSASLNLRATRYDHTTPQSMPSLSHLDETSAPAPSIGYGKTEKDESTNSTPPTKERPGFFRRVFGSSRNSPQQAGITLAGPAFFDGNRMGSRAGDRNTSNVKISHIAEQMKGPPPSQGRDAASGAPAVPPKDSMPTLNKKSSFFRRRKKSVSEQPPTPAVPTHQLLTTANGHPGEAAMSPTSSLRKVMNPYLRTPVSPDDTFYDTREQFESAMTQPDEQRAQPRPQEHVPRDYCDIIRDGSETRSQAREPEKAKDKGKGRGKGKSKGKGREEERDVGEIVGVEVKEPEAKAPETAETLASSLAQQTTEDEAKEPAVRAASSGAGRDSVTRSVTRSESGTGSGAMRDHATTYSTRGTEPAGTDARDELLDPASRDTQSTTATTAGATTAAAASTAAAATAATAAPPVSGRSSKDPPPPPRTASSAEGPGEVPGPTPIQAPSADADAAAIHNASDTSSQHATSSSSVKDMTANSTSQPQSSAASMASHRSGGRKSKLDPAIKPRTEPSAVLPSSANVLSAGSLQPSLEGDEEWVSVEPLKRESAENGVSGTLGPNRLVLQPSTSEENLIRENRFKDSNDPAPDTLLSPVSVSDYQSASSLPIPPTGENSPVAESAPETAPTSASAAGAADRPDPTVKATSIEPTIEDRGRAKQIYDGKEDFVSKELAAAWLGDNGPASSRARKAYMELFDWANVNILVAMRGLCSSLILKGETQQVDRILDAFSHRWCECNPNHGFKATDVVHTICYSILLLNTDLHMADIDQKMTRTQFVKNTMPTIRRVAADAAPASFEPSRSASLPGEPPETPYRPQPNRLTREGRSSTDLGLYSHRNSRRPSETEEAALRVPTPLDYDSPSDDCGPLVKTPFHGSLRTWEIQLEIVLKDFFNSIRMQRLPLHGAPIESSPDQISAGNSLSVFANGMLRRTPSAVSRAGSENQPNRGRAEMQRVGTGRFSSKKGSRPRVYNRSTMGSSRTSFDDESSMWSPSGSSTWSKYSFGKTQTSMSMDSLGSTMNQGGDYQQSIGFANALSQAIIREEAADMTTSPPPTSVAPLLEDETLGLVGAPWAKEGILKHKHHLESVNKRAKERNWSECFAVIEKGWMRLFSFSMKGSMRQQKKNRQSTVAAGGGVVGGGNWSENAEALGSFLLRQTIASALPPPGYSKARPHVWALSLPTGAVHLFQVGTPDIVKEFVSTANYWSARLSKEPLVGAISNIEYGWSDAIINSIASSGGLSQVAHSNSSHGAMGPPASAGRRPSFQSSIRSSIDNQTGNHPRPRLPGDRITISDWKPPQQSMMASQLLEVDQLRALTTYVSNIESELALHNELRAAVHAAFSPRHPNGAKAMANWERKSSYLLREIVKFTTYIDCLNSARAHKEKIYKERVEREGRLSAAVALAMAEGEEVAPDQREGIRA